MFLTQRGLRLLVKLLYAADHVPMDELKSELGVSARTIYYELKRVNDWLAFHQFDCVRHVRSSGFYIVSEQQNRIKEMLPQIGDSEYGYTPLERRALDLLFILSQPAPVFVEDLMELTDVSRNTVLEDIRLLKNELAKQGLTLDFKLSAGYFVAGVETTIRHEIHQWLNRIERLSEVNKLPIGIGQAYFPLSPTCLKELLHTCETELHIEFADHTLESFSMELCFYFNRIQRGKYVNVTTEEMRTLQETDEFTAALRFMTRASKEAGISIPDEEAYFLSTLFLSAKRQKQADAKQSQEHCLIHSIARNMIFEFQRYACIVFQDRDKLEANLVVHLKPAYYRMKYHVDAVNELADSVKQAHPEVYEITKKVVHHLEKAACAPASENEIAFLAMHFGGWMKREGLQPVSRCSVLIVCAEGVGTSAIVKQQLIDLLGYVNVAGILTKREYSKLDSVAVDFVVATTPVEPKGKPVHVVHPIFSNHDKKTLLKYGEASNGHQEHITLAKVVAAVRKHATVHNEQALLSELKTILQAPQRQWKEEWKPVLNELLTEKTIFLHQTAQDWKEAIKKAAAPLLADGAIEGRYVDAMIQSVEDNGPYIVITPGVAIPHSRPEAGVKRLGMSLATYKEGVRFSNKDTKPVKIVIVLAAIDSVTHLRALSQLTSLLGEPGAIDRLAEMTSTKEVVSLIQQFSTI